MFSEKQKLIAKELFDGALTLEELEKALKMSKEEFQEELQKMLDLKVIGKKQADEKELFYLKKSIAEELIKRKEIARKDTFELRLEAFIEAQAVEKDSLEKHLNNLVKGIKDSEAITVYSIKKAEIQKAEKTEYFSSYIEVNFSVKDLPTLIQFMFLYAPSTIEVLKPEKITLPATDLQEMLVQLSDITQRYNAFIQKSLSKKEIEEFHNKIKVKNQ